MREHLAALIKGLGFLLPAAAIGALAAGLAGALGGMLLVAILLLLRQNHYLLRLQRWSREAETGALPDTWGLWGDTLHALERRSRDAAAQRREMESALGRFRHAAEALPEGVVILDPHHRIEWINAQAEICLGLHAERDRGNVITHLLREPDFVALMASGARAPLEMRTQRNPGHVLQVQLAPFAESRTLLLVRDITQLERLATMRRDFVANVSHELKTPLTVTLGFIETAQDTLREAPADEIAGYLETAGDQARRMQRLIDDLLTLSALETDAPPPREEVVRVADLLGEVRSEALALSAGRHTLEVVPAPADVALRGARRELHSALLNLASNAVRYTPEGGRILLAWQAAADGGGGFSVKDSGIGIAAEHIGRLTERFYRVDRGRSRDAGGTGLGLAIVKHVLERHGAVLRIASTPGEGSEFRAEFPRSRLARQAVEVSTGGTADQPAR